MNMGNLRMRAGRRKPERYFLFGVWILLELAAAAGCCKKTAQNQERESAKAKAPAQMEPTNAVHGRLDLPVHARPARPENLAPGDPVWAVLPYPSHPQRYRLAPARVVRADPQEAVVENEKIRTGGVPYSLILARRESGVKPGDFVIAAGKIGVYAGRVQSRQGQSVVLERIWRDKIRTETLPSCDAIVQKGLREPGQIVFYQDQGLWNQGLLLALEERHAWVLESFGGAVLRVGEVEIQPWNPAFSPHAGQEVEACRGSSSHLVKAVITEIHPSGLLGTIRLSNGSSRERVPVWEMLPAGTVL